VFILALLEEESDVGSKSFRTCERIEHEHEHEHDHRARHSVLVGVRSQRGVRNSGKKNHFSRGRMLYIDSEKSIGHYTCTRG